MSGDQWYFINLIGLKLGIIIFGQSFNIIHSAEISLEIITSFVLYIFFYLSTTVFLV